MDSEGHRPSSHRRHRLLRGDRPEREERCGGVCQQAQHGPDPALQGRFGGTFEQVNL